MAEKNVIIRQLNDANNYVPTYPRILANQTVLSTSTAKLFGNSITNVDAAFKKIIDTLSEQGLIYIKVIDSNGNPIEGVKVDGLLSSPSTNSSGTVVGVFQADPLTFTSPYADISNGTANGASYVGTTNVLTVTLQSIADNSVLRYRSSSVVKFSNNVSKIDVCCVAGGGGGGGCDKGLSYSQAAGGGGGGGIVNSMNLAITANQSYNIIVGAGGNSGSIVDENWYPDINGSQGGTSSFGSLVQANGGEGGKYIRDDYAGGAAGATGCGNGGKGADLRTGTGNNGSSNTTLSEFNDNITFYSGGGGSGGAEGGSPNGAKGATATGGAKLAETGGGGGGAYLWVDDAQTTYRVNAGSKGGDGLVAIRVHLK